MNQDLMEWVLLLGRWLHITVAVTWIGTSIFFMWLDRSFSKNLESTREGHIGELWMVHGGGFYHVEKLMMGPTKVPKNLHWFKWESYWTWMSGFFLITTIFYFGGGTYLLDSSVSEITYIPAVLLGLFSIFGSWFFYDFLWERKITKDKPLVGHFFTMAWFMGMTYLLCHTLSGRAAYIHIGGMLGTWMTANVFMRIIPRQLKMVEASKSGVPVNQDWAKNAKNRSTHNTYFTLPVIFIMLSNHFPMTYGHEFNWLILLLLSAAGAAIREYFVVRINNPTRSIKFAATGLVSILAVVVWTTKTPASDPLPVVAEVKKEETVTPQAEKAEKVPGTFSEAKTSEPGITLNGVISFTGTVPAPKKLSVPATCSKGGPVYSNEVIVNNGKLENVLIRVTKGLEGKTFNDVPETKVELNQEGCIYHPRVTAARIGQEVVFINSDSIFHNVKSLTKNNESFNVPMAKKDQRFSKRFAKTEIFMQAKCSIHPWMGAFIAVVDNPYFSVSNAKGEISLKDLPPGKYTIEAWHEVYGTQTKEIEVSAANKPDLNFSFN
jgi:uncharacterized membrane protein/plastocyanin